MINPFVSDFVKQGVLKTPKIIDAFKKIDRGDFIPPELKDRAYINEPLPIGEGQTISQPITVAFMLELLQPEPGNDIFEIGFGSGWQTAILAQIVGKNGKIYAVERIPKLFRFGRKNIRKYNFIKKGIVKTFCGDATEGLKKYQTFNPALQLKGRVDRIVAAAATREIPEAWLKELKIDGRLVTPIKESVWLYVKKSDLPAGRQDLPAGRQENNFEKKEYPGFVFVPLVNS